MFSTNNKSTRLSLGGTALALCFLAIALHLLKYRALNLDRPGAGMDMHRFVGGPCWLLGTGAIALAVLALMGFGKRQGRSGSFLAVLAILLGSIHGLLIPVKAARSSSQEIVQSRMLRIFELTKAGRFDELQREADWVIRNTRESDIEARGVVHMALANMAFSGGNYKKAQLAAAKAVEINPETWQAHNLLGVALIHQGDYPAAVDALRKAVVKGANQAEPWANLGVAETATSNYSDAKRSLERSLQLNSNVAMTWVHLARLHYLTDELDEASQAVRRAHSLQRDLPEAKLIRGIIRFDQERYDECIDDLNQAFERGVDNEELRFFRGLAHANLEMPEAARTDLSRALEFSSDPTSRFLSYFVRAEMHYELGDFDECLEDCREAEGIRPDDADVWWLRAEAEEALGMVEQAEASRDRASQLEAATDEPTD